MRYNLIIRANITYIELEVESNKYIAFETKEMYAEDYLENGEFPESATHRRW